MERAKTERSEVPRVVCLGKKQQQQQPGLVRHVVTQRLHIIFGESQGSKRSVCCCILAQTSQRAQRGKDRLYRGLREAGLASVSGSQMGRDALGSSVGEDVLNHPVYYISVWQPEQRSINT